MDEHTISDAANEKITQPFDELCFGAFTFIKDAEGHITLGIDNGRKIRPRQLKPLEKNVLVQFLLQDIEE